MRSCTRGIYFQMALLQARQAANGEIVAGPKTLSVGISGQAEKGIVEQKAYWASPQEQ